MSPGSQTFEQDLFRLVRQGKISTDEALANADSATNLGLLLGNSGIMPADGRAREAALGAVAPGRAVLRRVPDHRGVGGAAAIAWERSRQEPRAVRGVPPRPPQHRDPFRRHPDDRAGARHRGREHRHSRGHDGGRRSPRCSRSPPASTTSGSISSSASRSRWRSSARARLRARRIARLGTGGRPRGGPRPLRRRLGAAVPRPPLRRHEARLLRRRAPAPHRPALRVRRGLLHARREGASLRRRIEDARGPRRRPARPCRAPARAVRDGERSEERDPGARQGAHRAPLRHARRRGLPAAHHRSPGAARLPSRGDGVRRRDEPLDPPRRRRAPGRARGPHRRRAPGPARQVEHGSRSCRRCATASSSGAARRT